MKRIRTTKQTTKALVRITTYGNMVTERFTQGFMKTTKVTITEDKLRTTLIAEKNGVCKVKYKSFTEIASNTMKKGEVVQVWNKEKKEKKEKIDNSTANTKESFDDETFIALRKVIIDHSNERKIDFNQALREVASVSNILQSEMSESAIAIILNISTDRVSKIINQATNKLKLVRELKDMSDEMKFKNGANIVLSKADGYGMQTGCVML